jgi:hypothetical protein
MSQAIKYMGVAFLVVLLFTSASHSSEYQGFGAETPGGSGQPVYRVTNLGDFGPGSLRDAVSRGNRYVVFDVAGEIILSDNIRVSGPYITIDGFTAPPPGITIKNRGLYVRGIDGAHDVIVRGIRVRDAAASSSTDCMQVSHGAYNVVVDHVSTYGCGDGGIDLTFGPRDVTVSWSILASPATGKKNMLIQDLPRQITLHHNLYIKSDSRNPQVRMDGSGTPATETTVDMRNNVIWDWGPGSGTHIRYGPWVNVINNFYAANGADARDALIVCPGPECDDSNPASAARVYAHGNISADGIDLDARGNQSTPFPAPQVDTQDALTAACLVLSDAGVRPLDAIDQQYLSEISLPWCGNVQIPPSGISLNASPTTIAAGGTLTAAWGGITAPTSLDWIGLYAPGAANTAYINWIYVSCSQIPGSARIDGSCPFVLPTSITAGTYELRLLANNGYTRLATSNALTVTP